ncbi:MAG: glycosyltransferase family 2 protein [Oscillatoria sp. SIO1A7]|nr:glycosyltransferase family 2 protein [Oscillatoria sp. SIO1A7]
MVALLGKPPISVIIPTYNRANLVRRAIDSVIKQSYENLEIIVVDDASGDNTQEVINGIGDSRIRYIRHGVNQGGAATRNTGIEAATGEYVAFLDSDDVWLQGKIEVQLAAIQNQRHTERIVSYTKFEIGDGEGVYIKPSRGKNEKEAVADYLFVHEGDIITSTMMLSRALVKETGFRPDLKTHQDWDFSLSLEAAGAQFIFVEKVLTVVDNEDRSDRISRIYDYKDALEWISEYEESISSNAFKGFLIKSVIPMMIATEKEKIYAAKIIIDAAWHGIISPQKVALLMRRVMFNKSVRQRWTKFRQNALKR